MNRLRRGSPARVYECLRACLGRVALAALLSGSLATIADPARAVSPVLVQPLDPREVHSLGGEWKMATGDDPARADPAFDDSSWAPIEVPRSGRPSGADAIRWLRRTVWLAAASSPAAGERDDVAVALGKINSAYEVYAGGILLGGIGGLPPSPRIDYDRHAIYRIPRLAIGEDGRLVLAVRVWRAPETRRYLEAMHEGVFELGPMQQLVERQIRSDLPSLVVGLLFLIGGGIYLELFRRHRRYRAYLWLGLLALEMAAYSLLRTQWKYALGGPFAPLKDFEYALLLLTPPTLIRFIAELLRGPLGRLARVLAWVGIGGAAIVALPGLGVNLALLPAIEVFIVLCGAVAMVELYRARARPEARILLLACGVALLLVGRDIAVDRGLVTGARIAPLGFVAFGIGLFLSSGDHTLRLRRETEDLRQHLEERVAERTRELAQASAAKDRFLAVMSHEMRTPLNAILGTHELISRQPLAEEQSRLMSIATRGGQSLLALVDDILDFSRIQGGSVRLEPAAVRLEEILATVVNVGGLLARQRGIQLRWRQDDGLPEWVLADAKRLHQVLLNLVTNALKFTQEGSVEIVVERGAGAASPAGTPVRFRVSDTGIGIPEAQLAKVLEPFTQVDSTVARRYGGAGLGLAISNSLIGMMGGRLRLKSAEGEGTTCEFELRLPSALGQPSSMPPGQGPARPAEGRETLRVLLVEDDPASQVVVEAMLAEFDCQTTVVPDGEAALERIAKHPFDIVVLDIRLPGIDGLEVARRVVAMPLAWPRPWLAGLTANAFPEDRTAALVAGMDDFLTKPIALDALAKALDVARAARARTPASS